MIYDNSEQKEKRRKIKYLAIKNFSNKHCNISYLEQVNGGMVQC